MYRRDIWRPFQFFRRQNSVTMPLRGGCRMVKIFVAQVLVAQAPACGGWFNHDRSGWQRKPTGGSLRHWAVGMCS